MTSSSALEFLALPLFISAEEIRISSQKPLDDIIRFGLSNNFLKESLCSFPDPRQGFDIPIDILLLPQIIQRLDDEHSLVSAPYMLNSSELITRLGYSAKVLETGFNRRCGKQGCWFA